MGIVDKALVDFPTSGPTTNWLRDLDMSKFKDSMMLTALTFMRFGSALGDSIRVQTQVVRSLSDSLTQANGLLADINNGLKNPGVTDSTFEFYAFPTKFATQQDALDYAAKFVAEGATTYDANSSALARDLGIRGTAPELLLYAYRSPMKNMKGNLEAAINSTVGLTTNAQLSLNKQSTGLGNSMDYVTAAFEKWAKLSQSFVDNFHK